MDNVRILLKVIVKRDNKLLALKRSPTDDARPDCWDLPGGNLEYGEDMNQRLITEIREESGLEVINIKPLHTISAVDPVKNLYWVEIGYVCDYSQGEVVLSSEHYDFRWVTKDEFLELESADFLREFVQRM